MSQQLALHLGAPPTTIFIGSLAAPLRFRGPWSSTTFYSVNDVVSSGGNLYQAILPNTNVAVATASTWTELTNGSYQGAGTSFAVPSRPNTKGPAGASPITWYVITSCTDLTVELDGSLDGTNWFKLDSYTTAAGGNALQVVANNPVNFVRANVTATDSGWTVVEVQL